MDTTHPVEDEPKSDAWYEAEVDRMLLKLQRMPDEMNDPEERRRSEAHRIWFDAKMAEINKTLDAVAADRRMSYLSPVERQDHRSRSGNKHSKYKRRRKVS